MNILRVFIHHPNCRALILFSLASISVLSLLSYNSSDPSFNLVTGGYPNNLLSYMGSYISDFLLQFFGLGSFVIPVCFFPWSYFLFKEKTLSTAYFRIIMMVAAIVTIDISLGNLPIYSLPAGGGGIIGILIWQNIADLGIIINLFAAALAIICLSASLKISFSVYAGILPWVWSVIAPITIRFNNLIRSIKYKTKSPNYNYGYNQELEPIKLSTKKVEPSLFPVRAPSAGKLGATGPQKQSHEKLSPAASDISFDQENLIPSVDLLDEAHNQVVKPLTATEIQQNAEDLLAVLGDFGVKGKIIDVRQGPVVTLYEFEPAAGTKSSRIIGLAEDIARSLSALSTRIAVIPGRNALGIELPNKQRMFFRLKELIQTDEFQSDSISLPIILGKDLGGRPLIADLAKMPHLLVAGTTGSGKSVAINAMIMSLLYRYTPEECRMVMIDPKMLELSAYDNIPHLMTPVVTEPAKAVVALKWAVKEMENRYRLMSNLGVRNIAGYNAKILEVAKNNQVLERKVQTGFDPETGKPIFDSIPIEIKKMPFIVVIVDEMADLMLVAGKDIETSIQRLAQMARAAGIHIIMATQRPSVDVITGVIKANFPSRISFKVTSKIDSRTILGDQGAEQLLGMGDMLYMGNSSRILRVHGPFVDDKEVERVTDFLRTTGFPDYISAVTESADKDSDSEDDFDVTSEDDDLYKQAINIVRTERKSSISYIQRSLRIGYNRAANIVELMEKNGVLSSPGHTGKRDILLPED